MHIDVEHTPNPDPGKPNDPPVEGGEDEKA